jgi:hypothetical protein
VEIQFKIIEGNKTNKTVEKKKVRKRQKKITLTRKNLKKNERDKKIAFL